MRFAGRRLGLTAMLLLGGCSLLPAADPGWSQPAAANNTWVYRCDQGLEAVARAEGERLWLFLPRQTLSLERVGGSQESRFQSESVTLLRTTTGAQLRVGEQSYQCVNDPRAAVWEASKLNGFDFRGVGNEPGWYLEIGRGVPSQLVTDYGSTRLVFDLPEAETESTAGVTLYRIPQEKLAIRIEALSCNDSMSGEVFSSRVEVVWGALRLRGCGRPLH
ncbi:hypothetical protein D0544_14600 [Aestuariirhabdus litorea]|uniref:C-type lysozyme inhibitor domain-containing protein n=2 Tax=Aestuariirhabdus litorea TaxID=2528527 RepID=A0A3P3VL66_9GAMM|nr:hypothetical protein D0544_14600 [Aestuariirhabdus litorea]